MLAIFEHDVELMKCSHAHFYVGLTNEDNIDVCSRGLSVILKNSHEVMFMAPMTPMLGHVSKGRKAMGARGLGMRAFLGQRSACVCDLHGGTLSRGALWRTVKEVLWWDIVDRSGEQ